MCLSTFETPYPPKLKLITHPITSEARMTPLRRPESSSVQSSIDGVYPGNQKIQELKFCVPIKSYHNYGYELHSAIVPCSNFKRSKVLVSREVSRYVSSRHSLAVFVCACVRGGHVGIKTDHPRYATPRSTLRYAAPCLSSKRTGLVEGYCYA